MSVLLADGRLPGIIEAESEFLVQGAMGACGPNMAAMLETYGAQVYVSTPTLYKRMRAANRCAVSGVTQMGPIVDQLRADGYRVDRPAAGANLLDFAKAKLADGAAVGFEPSRGQVLVDLISGTGMNAKGLTYHFDMAAGYWRGGYNETAGKNLPEGLWMCDGDSSALSGTGTAFVNGRYRVQNGRRLQYYALSNMVAASLYTAIAVYPKVQIAPVLTTAPDPKYKGWRYDANANKLYPPSVGDVSKAVDYFERGFARYVWAAILAGTWSPDQEPLGREFAVPWVEEANRDAWGAGSIILLRVGYLAWSAKAGRIYTPWSGQELREFRKRLNLAYQAA